jgi:hypothetical protein
MADGEGGVDSSSCTCKRTRAPNNRATSPTGATNRVGSTHKTTSGLNLRICQSTTGADESAKLSGAISRHTSRRLTASGLEIPARYYRAQTGGPNRPPSNPLPSPIRLLGQRSLRAFSRFHPCGEPLRRRQDASAAT